MKTATDDLVRFRSAVDDFLTAADACADTWTDPVRPGKWSPSQILEHVARSIEESARDIQGERSKMPQIPAPVRFLARSLVLKRVLKNGALPPSKTNRAMDPLEGPPSPAVGRDRVESAWRAFEAARGGVVGPARSRVFGTVPVSDYVRFQELHTRHHRAQLPDA